MGSRNLRINEGGAVVTTIRLATAPSGDVQVAIERSAGDSDGFD